jgi:hypothetical protein
MMNYPSFSQCTRFVRAGSSLSLLAVCGCARAPAFNILGSFFPGWIACILAGILLTALVRWGLSRWNLERELKALPLVYISIALIFACTFWLFFFE